MTVDQALRNARNHHVTFCMTFYGYNRCYIYPFPNENAWKAIETECDPKQIAKSIQTATQKQIECGIGTKEPTV